MSGTKSSKSEALNKLQTHAKPILAFIENATPQIIAFCYKAKELYQTLPEDELYFIFGAIICFFGGVYPTLFAAIEAAKHGGIAKVQLALKDLANEAIVIIEASKKDDDVDNDNDGKRDVDQLDAKQLVLRKVNLVMTKMNPEKVNTALSSIYTTWVAVVAVVAIQFAKTVAFAETICTFVRKPISRHVTPKFIEMTPPEYQKWVPILIGWATKAFSISIAFFLTQIIAAFTASLIGGLMMTRALMKIATKKGWAIGELMAKDDKETVLDEYIAYAIAFAGFYFQWKISFAIPFPLNLIFFPFGMAEQSIRWSITSA